ncbi:hypothetical protein ACFTWF_35025 [Rhodococcus sp. NPDC056960]|uniref:hypothetical protein n=1 Tax=Rhodococcus sp. NPDC056960 TaxID=3345982 RepID=UPI00363376DB
MSARFESLGASFVMDSEPSDWALTAFGAAAEPLMRAIPRAITAAHERAMGAHFGGGMRTADAYGSTLAVAQFEELVRETQAIPGVRVEKPLGMPARFGLVMLGDPVTALYPWRYARDGSTRREDARLTNPSKLRTSLLTLPSGPVSQQLSLDEHANLSDAELEELLADEQIMREQVRSLGQVVTIGYASNSIGQGSIFDLGWGFAELLDEESGAMSWNSWQSLSTSGESAGADQSLRPALRIVDPQATPRRFNDAPLDDDLDLTARIPDGAAPISERQREPDETGSSDE